MEMTAGIGTLLTSLPRLELAVESAQLEWHSSLILHGVNCLPVRVAG
jgi:cytochrome P450